MNRFRAVFAAVVMLTATSSVAFAEYKPADPREKLDTAVAEVIRLIETRDPATFFEKYTSAGTIDGLTNKGKMPLADLISESKRVAGTNPERSKALASEMKKTQGTEPIMSDNGLTATFKAADPFPYHSISLVMKKEGNYWKYHTIQLSTGK